MTDAQIEQIARAYCRKLGLDPDERVPFIRFTFNLETGVTSYEDAFRPMWECQVSSVREALDPIAMRDAIDQALGEKGAGHATTV